ncbi:DUF2500 family protein [Faecalicoccus pleomorphus]|uniref:DUF2500 family protein n=1 Tax=Faecalicoccus pleomorphus TaxID=1323 RepID=A0A3E3DU10_9FIRM|nr:DUF2500 family protein [Faecalicoccus pleomorphus]RGD72784.1 DUF2500 family protein [Faecalicoccus pleomorphus]
MHRCTNNKYKKESLFAELIDKKSSNYFAIPGKIPTPEIIYETIFMTDKGVKESEVSVFEYNVVDIGMKGILFFQGYELISFGDWIKEFRE